MNIDKLERDRERLRAKKERKARRSSKGAPTTQELLGDASASPTMEVSAHPGLPSKSTTRRQQQTVPTLGPRRRWKWLHRLGWYELAEPTILTSTRQGEALNTALVNTHPPLVGPLLGIDIDNGQPYTQDPFFLYAAGRLTSPNVLILGSVGTGKPLDVATMIPMPDEQWKAIGDLKVGDIVLDELHRPTRVVAVSDVMYGEVCYEIVLQDDASVIAAADHLWQTTTRARVPATTVPAVGVRYVDPLGGPAASVPLPQGRRRIDVFTTAELAATASLPDGLPAHRIGDRDVISVTEVASRPVRCIEVSAESSMFLAGEGKVPTHNSSLTKTQFVTRQLALGRQVAVFDRKNQRGRGEYLRVADAAGATTVRLARNGGHCINIFDPRIVATSRASDTDGDGEATVVGQDQLLLLVAERAHGKTLSSEQRHALRAAHKAALAKARAGGRVANIRDVIEALYDPQESSVARPHLIAKGWVDQRRLFEAGYEVALDLERYVDGDLSGLIDGATSTEIDLDAPLIVIDTSNLDEDSPALGLMMVVMTTFLSAVWAERPGQRTLVVEEGYHVLLDGVSSVFKSLAKRGRGIGLSVVTVLHHISDIPETSDALALIREAGIVHIYAQHTEADQLAAARLFHLPPVARDLLPILAKGHSIVKVGSDPVRVVRHLLATSEVELVNTDDAMLGRNTHPHIGDEAPAAVVDLTTSSGLAETQLEVDEVDVDELLPSFR